jgi:hypothetical protein
MTKINRAYRYLQRRLSEPSTSASLSAILGTFGISEGNPWLTAASLGFGLAGIFLGENNGQ